MSKSSDHYIFATVCLLIAFSFAMGWIGRTQGHMKGYKQGQIDAINGQINYEKQIQADSSVVWKRIE